MGDVYAGVTRFAVGLLRAHPQILEDLTGLRHDRSEGEIFRPRGGSQDMIIAAHTVIFADDAEQARAFFAMYSACPTSTRVAAG